MAGKDTEILEMRRPHPAVTGGESSDSDHITLPHNADSDGEQLNGPEFALPPADGGIQAWLFLLACTMIEALVWGFPFAYGVFQEYYSTHPPFQGSKNIPVIGTCAMGIMYLACPLVFWLLQSYPKYRRVAATLGLITMCLAISLSSFCTTVEQLIATQGVIFAIGGAVGYAPTILFLDEWFIVRKGFAFGIMWSGTGVAGFALPLVIQWLLNTYGYQTTLRVWAICLFVLTAPLMFFLRPRLPLSQTTQSKRFDFGFLKSPSFLVIQVCNIMESFGFFLPGIYLPTYAKHFGASNLASTIPVILVNVSSVFGCIIMGYLVDRFHVTTCMIISTVGTVIGVFFIWGFATSLPTLLVFASVYGLFAGAYTSTWPGAIKAVQKKRETANPGMIFAWLAAGRGIGNVVSGPLSEAMIKGASLQGKAAWGYGTDFGSLIIFTGVTAVLGGMSFLGRRVGWL